MNKEKKKKKKKKKPKLFLIFQHRIKCIFSRNDLFVKLRTLQIQTRIETVLSASLEGVEQLGLLLMLPVQPIDSLQTGRKISFYHFCFCNARSLTKRTFLQSLHPVRYCQIKKKKKKVFFFSSLFFISHSQDIPVSSDLA